ncbi:MAG: hypothetical protein WA210_18715, partial [Burkholderiaceae bacterium]
MAVLLTAAISAIVTASTPSRLVPAQAWRADRAPTIARPAQAPVRRSNDQSVERSKGQSQMGTGRVARRTLLAALAGLAGV